MNNKGKGALGEYLAVDFLKKKGYKILSTNANFCGCELDVVAIKTVKAQKKQIKIEYKNSEVKYSSSKVYGEPYERVTKEKQKHIIRASEGFMFKNRLQMPVSYDVISVVGKEINHIENAFYA